MLFFDGYVGTAKRLGTVAYEHESFGSDVGDLIIVFGAEKKISFFSRIRSSPFSPLTDALPSSTRKVSGDK